MTTNSNYYALRAADNAHRQRLAAGTASETEYLHSINAKLGSINAIAIWFLILSILGIVIGILVAANSH